MPSSYLLGAFTALLTLVSASPLQQRAAIPPSQDPFYSAPSGYQDAAPGTILRSRLPPSPLAAFSTPLNLKGSYQIQFRTTDSLGDPEAAITTVLVPHNVNTAKLVSYQDFEDSASGDCATSYALQSGSSNNGTLSKVDVLIITGLLQEGYIVSLPDYEGPEGQFAAGVQAGQATLDSIRAVLSSSEITGIAPKDVGVTMWGYSGGSIATEWAAELQPKYAPELKILGAAIGGTISNTSSVLTTINKGVFAGFAPAGILGSLKAYPSLRNFYESEIIPSKKADFERVLTQCAAQDLQDFAFQDIGSYFKDGIAAFSNPDIVAVLNAGGVMGLRDTPEIPLYFYKAVADEISPSADNDKLVHSYCSKGIKSLQYYRDVVGEHATEMITGVGGAIEFLRDRFDGVPAPQGCTIKDVALSRLTLGVAGGFSDVLVGDLNALLGLPLGPAWF